MADVTKAYETLDGFFRDRARDDGTMAINFITHFKSKEKVFRAFDELSFVEAVDGTSALPEGISAKTLILTDEKRIARVFLVGRFTIFQAREVVRAFSKYSYKKGNDKFLAEAAAQFAISLQEKGGGGVIWIEWNYKVR